MPGCNFCPIQRLRKSGRHDVYSSPFLSKTRADIKVIIVVSTVSSSSDEDDGSASASGTLPVETCSL